MSDIPFPSAKITESNNEVSCSIEETNRIRISLGMRPLDVGKSTDSVVVVSNEAEVSQDPAVSTKELSERLAAAKFSRIKGLADDSVEDPEDWVKRVGVKRKVETVVSTGKRQKYDPADLSGIKVSHSVDDFEMGRDVILTLKDSEVLDDSEEVLENLNMAESRIGLRNSSRRTRSSLKTADDEKEAEAAEFSKEFILGDGGSVDMVKLKALEESRRDIELRQKAGVGGAALLYKDVDTLKMKPRTGSDIMAAEETRVKVKPRRKKHKRTAVVDLEKELGVESGSLASRTDAGWMENQEEKQAQSKRERAAVYDAALAKAETKSHTLLIVSESDEEDIDVELQRSLQRAKNRKKATPAPKLKDVLQQARDLEERSIIDKKKDRVVFSSAESFVGSMDSAAAPEPVQAVSTFELDNPRESTPSPAKLSPEPVHKMDIDGPPKADPSVNQEEDDIMAFMIEEPLTIHRGVAGILRLLRARGAFAKRNQVVVGRAMDSRSEMFERSGTGDPNSRVRLEYLDDQGRPLSKKEAYRHLSHKFHNKAPSAKRLEKRQREYERGIRAKKLASQGGGATSSLSKLAQSAKRMGKAYVVLDAKGRPFAETMLPNSVPVAKPVAPAVDVTIPALDVPIQDTTADSIIQPITLTKRAGGQKIAFNLGKGRKK